MYISHSSVSPSSNAKGKFGRPDGAAAAAAGGTLQSTEVVERTSARGSHLKTVKDSWDRARRLGGSSICSLKRLH